MEGDVFGMYFFGYGSFGSSMGDLGVTPAEHISINASYFTRIGSDGQRHPRPARFAVVTERPIRSVEFTFQEYAAASAAAYSLAKSVLS